MEWDGKYASTASEVGSPGFRGHPNKYIFPVNWPQIFGESDSRKWIFMRSDAADTDYLYSEFWVDEWPKGAQTWTLMSYNFTEIGK